MDRRKGMRAVGVLLLAVIGCGEMTQKKVGPESPEPPATATELLAGTYEAVWLSPSGDAPQEVWKLKIDGTAEQGEDPQPGGVWWYYPERRALTLGYTGRPVVIDGGVTYLLPDGWKTGDPLCIEPPVEEGDSGCSRELRRTPAPAEGGELIETSALTRDDTPSSWAGSYELRPTGDASDEGMVRYELNADGTGAFKVESEAIRLQVEGSWWYQAERRALSLSFEGLLPGTSLTSTFVVPEGWNGELVCLAESRSDSMVPTCEVTFGRITPENPEPASPDKSRATARVPRIDKRKDSSSSRVCTCVRVYVCTCVRPPFRI